MGRQKKPRVGATSVQVVESDFDDEPATVQLPRRRSNRPGAGVGGRNSQLEKIGNAIQTPVRASSKSKVQNVVVPSDEPENAMALVAKKKGRGKAPRQLERNLSVIQEASESSLTAADPIPTLHVTDQGRFGLQDRPIPSAYPYVRDRGTSQGASHCGASRGTSRGTSQRSVFRGASRTSSVPHGAPLHDPQADRIGPPAVQHPASATVGAHVVSHDPPESSVSDRRLGSSTIPIRNPLVQQHLSATMTPHCAVACPPAFGSSSGPDIFVDDAEEGNKEADGEGDIEEDVMYNEGGDSAEEDVIDIDMEHEEDFRRTDDIMQPSEHDDQMYPSNQVRRPAQAPDQGAYFQDEDSNRDNVGATGMYRNDRTSSRKSKDRHINIAQAPKRASLQSTDKRARSRSNTLVVPNIDYDVLQAHHKKNHRPCSPSPTYLNSVRNRHLKTKCAHTRNTLSSDDSDQSEQDDLEDLANEVEIDTGRRRRTKKAKGATTNRDATNVGFYPSLWQKLLDRAKANFRLHIAISVPFPDKEESIGSTGVCGEVIAEAIVHWQEQKRKLEKAYEGYYPEFKMEMATVVLNDAATFRSKVKQITLTVIPMVYELALGINGNTIDSIKLKATGLLKKAMYLHGHPDSEGCASNFANDVIRIACHKSFYDNGSKSLKQFAEFQKTVPPPALFLVGTIVSVPVVCLNKYGQVNGAKQTPIEDLEASYDRISTLFDRMNKDEYHGPKLRQMLKAWALEGMNAHGAVFGADEGDDGCSEWDVDLD
ncbi:uncharacterized protein HD556DRAFT_1308286 [Suillus plorans]|uniref:DUF6532 domain-containing protein n=1 Tax=Suillus plorans TaxID=116603 RepID=A0A9P7AQF5_9AGAM|nr:uncharacterized protein HD556DRAFT_1308286 [Suillus plorans]KAG1794237.1 hypothetical protein HD556DRAFT_1308286 [Suillus plorans]